MRRKLPSLDKRHAKHRDVSPEETRIWRQETETDKAARAARKAPPRPNAEPSSPRRRSNGPSEADLAAPAAPRPPEPRAPLRPRRGAETVQAALDLHGHTVATAHPALLRFLAQARAQGLRLVLVITGKGKRGGGVLRDAFPRWLEVSPLADIVLSCDVAGLRHGGDGAWYVRLRKKNEERRPGTPS